MVIVDWAAQTWLLHPVTTQLLVARLLARLMVRFVEVGPWHAIATTKARSHTERVPLFMSFSDAKGDPVHLCLRAAKTLLSFRSVVRELGS